LCHEEALETMREEAERGWLDPQVLDEFSGSFPALERSVTAA
jgi:response regulator RpfG family c-di-GMP phosphodiesterase